MTKKILIFLSILFCCAAVCQAQPTFSVRLYPEGDANVEMDVYIPADFYTGKYIVVCPGGGYAYLSLDNEGSLCAEWLNTQGIAAAVLHYRLPEGRCNIPLKDALAAVGKIRAIAAKKGSGGGTYTSGGPQMVMAKPPVVGIMGFSAGGHLASTVLTQYTSLADRPDFGVLFYPVITMDAAFTHQGSRKHLLGENASDELVRRFSSELNVKSDTPPVFIVSILDDKVVPVKNSLVFYQALADNNVPAEMHIYPSGEHGFGFKWNFEYRDELYQALVRWIGEQN